MYALRGERPTSRVFGRFALRFYFSPIATKGAIVKPSEGASLAMQNRQRFDMAGLGKHIERLNEIEHIGAA